MRNTVLYGDCLTKLKEIPACCVQTCVTSPPYWSLRSYLPDDHVAKESEIGRESTPGQYITKIVQVFREVRRTLRTDGTLWLNMGDTFITQPHHKDQAVVDPKAP